MVGLLEGETTCIIKNGIYALYVLTLFTILIWGSAFPAIRMGLASYTPEHLTLLRLLIASFILLVVFFYLQVTNVPV